MKLRKKEKTLTMAAAKAGMSRNPARKYLKSGKLPSESRSERTWRTRPNPYESVWPEIEGILKQSPTVEATTIFDHLNRIYEGKFEEGQLRTLQRRLKQWRAHYGELKEVMFPQNHEPGHQAQSDFTFMNSFGVTIAGQPFPHMLYHFVLTYSNWETTTLCFGESFESLTLGLQNAIWELGAIPSEHRTDRLSAVVNNLKKGAFTERYQTLLDHYGMKRSRTQAGKAHENGDVEQSHHRLKRAIQQELLLRGSRDFSERKDYEQFVQRIIERRNAGRQRRLREELEVMRPLTGSSPGGLHPIPSEGRNQFHDPSAQQHLLGGQPLDPRTGGGATVCRSCGSSLWRAASSRDASTAGGRKAPDRLPARDPLAGAKAGSLCPLSLAGRSLSRSPVPSRLRRAERGLSTDGGPTVSGDPGAGGPRRGKESRTSSEEPD